MFRSFHLFTALGIPVRVHMTLLVFLPFLAWSLSGYDDLGFISALVLAVLVFACILLHEFGHCAVALAYRVPVRSITLTPIGGIAGLARMPREPLKELLITVAGPAVNLVLAAGFFAAQIALDHPILGYLVIVNLALGIFNLLPGFPMDGGRVLRSLLAFWLPYLRATEIAVLVGRVTALGLGIFGLYHGNFMLVLVAMFVYFAARAELFMVRMQESPLGQFAGGQSAGGGQFPGGSFTGRQGPQAGGLRPEDLQALFERGQKSGGSEPAPPPRGTSGPRDFVQLDGEVRPER